ncbi:hypothetical protein M6B38_236725 [Iris pallida]|uniref:Uncharacterized protein n=1 Tax=Iris pallida TaxID=29817 RepID=A0AAX6DNJ6_IRIPA|nr:hypothetical protein M6B38_236725 [Iris pallida]
MAPLRRVFTFVGDNIARTTALHDESQQHAAHSWRPTTLESSSPAAFIFSDDDESSFFSDVKFPRQLGLHSSSSEFRRRISTHMAIISDNDCAKFTLASNDRYPTTRSDHHSSFQATHPSLTTKNDDNGLATLLR